MEDYPQQFKENDDLKRKWMNMVTNEGFKQKFTGHQIRVKIQF